jgi:hypothetical protein
LFVCDGRIGRLALIISLMISAARHLSALKMRPVVRRGVERRVTASTVTSTPA